MCLNMDSKTDIERLFRSMDSLVGATNKTNVAIEGLRGDVKVLGTRIESIDEHKADKDEISQLITNNFKIHEVECATRKDGSSKGKFWSGMSAGQKMTIVGSVIAAIGSWVTTFINSSAG